MSYSRLFILVAEFFSIAILCLCGVVAFSNSGIYSGFQQFIAKIVPAVSTYLALIIFLALLGPGIFLIMLRNRGGGWLAITVTVLSLPSLFSFNNIDLLKIFGSSSHITTGLSFTQMLSIGLLIISTYSLIDLMNLLKHHTLLLKRHEAQPADIEAVQQRNHLVIIILTGGALFISLVISAVARGFEFIISRNSYSLSWWIVPMSLACIFVLGVYLYWITTRKIT